MMKIKFWDRIVLFFGAIIVIAAGAALIVAGLQVTGFMIDALPFWARIVSICVGALSVLFGVYLLAFPRKFRTGRHDFVVQRTDNGELRISVKAIEGLVQKCIDMHDEIKVVSQRIHNTREGVVVDLNIALANNISIPLAVAALQKQIKQYLSASSGIDVTEVRVSVDTAQFPMKGRAEAEAAETPQAEPESQEADAPAQEEPKAPKLPLHQRIFGRPETPANMPEPPKPEEPEAPAEEAEQPTVETPMELPAEETPAAEQPAEEAAAPEQPAEEAAAVTAPDADADGPEEEEIGKDAEETIHE